MFFKHLADLLFQITAGSKIFEPLTATKKADVRHCLGFFLPLHLLDFATRPFPSKALKKKPSSSMFQ